MLVKIQTQPKRDSENARKIISSDEEDLWRVHFRRGLVDTRDGPRSATAVLGVQFRSTEIQKPGG